MKRNHRKTKTLLVTAMLACVCFTASAASYQYGDRGKDVAAIQQKLIAHGYHARPNSEYDANTKWAVRLFQRDNGLEVDGIVGPATYAKLMGKAMPANAQVARPAASRAAASARAKAPSSRARTNTRASAMATNAESVTAKHWTRHRTGSSVAGTSSNIRKMLSIAESYQGVPYVWGGNTPSGFDCSGYTKYVFEKVGVNLPRLADEQYNVGTRIVSRSALKPGDLVFFETYEPGASHSGIYVGDGKFISATSSQGIAIASLMDGYWGERYLGGSRVLK